MQIRQLNVDLSSLNRLDDLYQTLRKLYLEYYLLDDRKSGVSLRKQIKAIEFQLKVLHDESLEIKNQRKSISYELTPFALSKARIRLNEELSKCF